MPEQYNDDIRKILEEYERSKALRPISDDLLIKTISNKQYTSMGQEVWRYVVLIVLTAATLTPVVLYFSGAGK